MPKVGRMSERQREIVEILRRDYATLLTLADVGRIIGTTDQRTTKKYVEGLRTTDVNGRRKWLIDDIARRIYEHEV